MRFYQLLFFAFYTFEIKNAQQTDDSLKPLYYKSPLYQLPESERGYTINGAPFTRPQDQDLTAVTRNEAEKDTILTISCLVCCKLKKNVSICASRKICDSLKCSNYMEKNQKRRLTGRNRSILPSNRFPRRYSIKSYGNNSKTGNLLCKELHPKVDDIIFLDVLPNSECLFHCTSTKEAQQYSHNKENGSECSKNRVCWLGTCTNRGDTVDQQMCQHELKSKNVIALVSLPCQLVCQKNNEEELWVFNNIHSPVCLAPSWLPRRQDNY